MAAQRTSSTQSEYQEAIAHFATGVTVITTSTDEGPAGMTASAVASLSLDPIMLLVCVSTELPTHTALESAGRFVVNVLGEGQEELAMHFARPHDDKFAEVRLKEGQDLPVLDDAIAHFTCVVRERFPGGDHTIFVGEVEDCGCRHGRRPLLYFRSSFFALDDPERALARAWNWDV